MKSVQFDLKLPRYVFTKTLGRWMPSLHWHPRLSCLQYRELPEPQLPGEDWTKIKVKYGGICGSDLNLIFLRDSPVTSPYASFPFTLGHEIVGQVQKKGTDVNHVQEGDRVVVDPVLSCRTRGFDNLCPACTNGDDSLCHRKTEGYLSPGLLTGTCRDTGGSWSPYLVAHESQIIPLPDEVNDYNGAMVEPFSCAIHSVLRNPPRQGEQVLVLGSGVIGICTIAALRALGYDNEVIAVAKHDFQAQLAQDYGADKIVRFQSGSAFDQDLAQSSQAQLLKPVFGEKVVQGGFPLIYECVGTQRSINDALRFAHNGGKIVLVGLAGMMKGLDWTKVWLNELEIKGSFAYSNEEYKGKKMRTLEIAIELMKEGKVDLSPLITHTFPLEEYREAIKVSTQKGKGKTLKVLLEPTL